MEVTDSELELFKMGKISKDLQVSALYRRGEDGSSSDKAL